nr:Chain C, Nucleoprotein [Influenza A virus (A/chicken/Soc Trang/4/2012(H5N1))]
TMVMELIRMIK